MNQSKIIKVKKVASYTINNLHPYSFQFSLTHYVIPAWYSIDDTLVRIIRLGKNNYDIFLLEITPDCKTNTNKLDVNIWGIRDLSKSEFANIQLLLLRCLQLNEEKDTSQLSGNIIKIMRDDSIVRTAITYNGIFIRGKLYPDLFEAICGIICGQRTTFSRIPTMMGNMASNIAPNIVFKNHVFPAFPLPSEILQSGEDLLRKCGLGFRSKRIYQLSQKWIELDFQQYFKLNEKDLKEKLIELPGVGPYTANLALGLSGRLEQKKTEPSPEPHIDSFVQRIIGFFYFDGTTQDADKTYDFVTKQWGTDAEAIISHLTTNTHEWALELGYKFPLRSGAKAKFEVQKITQI